MTNFEELRDSLPAAAADLRVNLHSVLTESSLGAPQRWGVAITCAIVCRNPALVRALMSGAAGLDATVEEDARAAASLMAMNNVYFRFKHVIGKDEYDHLPVRLRMSRLAKPLASKADFELFCLAASAILGCEGCMQGHEESCREQGFSAEQVSARWGAPWEASTRWRKPAMP